MENPWKAVDLSRAARFGSPNAIEAAVERDLIDREYAAGGMDDEVCGKCGKVAHYRPGVGTLECPNRHVLAYNGDWR